MAVAHLERCSLCLLPLLEFVLLPHFQFFLRGGPARATVTEHQRRVRVANRARHCTAAAASIAPRGRIAWVGVVDGDHGYRISTERSLHAVPYDLARSLVAA